MKRLFLLLVAALALLAPAVGQAASGPAIAFNPSSNDYGTIDANTTSSQTFTLRNSGGKGTSALKVTITGSSAFSVTADGCTGTSLGPKKQCSVTVRYAPTTLGQTDSATLAASSKKPPATASALLTGKANGSDCDFFNDQPFFNRLYGSLGTSGTFAAGDVLTLSAGGPENPGPFPTTQIILSVDGSFAASAPFPGGTIVYTFATDGFYALQWNSDSGGVTWTVSCAQAS